MATLHRLDFILAESPIFYITTCTYNRRRILDRRDVHNSFVEFGLNARDRGIWVGRYVIMPDHIHMFAGFEPESLALSVWMKSFKNAISKTLTNATFLAPHWQKGFFDHVIRSRESYEQKSLYVWNNPVRAGLVQASSDWPYAGEIWSVPL